MTKHILPQHKGLFSLTQWSLNKMTDILQTTFSMHFHERNILYFNANLKCHGIYTKKTGLGGGRGGVINIEAGINKNGQQFFKWHLLLDFIHWWMLDFNQSSTEVCSRRVQLTKKSAGIGLVLKSRLTIILILILINYINENMSKISLLNICFDV